MWKRMIRNFAYMPKNNLKFVDGKCLIYEDLGVRKVFVNTVLFPMGFYVLLLLRYGSELLIGLPYYSFSAMNCYFILGRFVHKMSLHKDGKSVSVSTAVDLKEKVFQITDIVDFPMPEYFKSVGTVKKFEKLPFVFSKNLENQHADVVAEVLLGNEINTE